MCTYYVYVPIKEPLHPSRRVVGEDGGDDGRGMREGDCRYSGGKSVGRLGEDIRREKYRTEKKQSNDILLKS